MFLRLFFLLLFFCSTPVWAALKIDVSGAKTAPIPVALPDFSVQDEGLKDIAKQITAVVKNDLESSGLFRVIDSDAYLQKFFSLEDEPRFTDWQVLNAQGLIQGEISQNPNGDFKVSFLLWDVYGGHQLMPQRNVGADKAKWRKLAHIVSDTVYERMTGDTGYFDSKIVFVSESGSAKKRKRRLAVMDIDGANLKFLTDNKTMVMTPRFAPKDKKIAYMSYQSGEPKVYIMDLETGKNELVGKFKGMSFAPRFSPDGKKLIMSLSEQGNTEIYLYDLTTGQQKKLTNHPAIDTSPSFSADGKSIVFNSDRSGKQQLYVMDANGENVRRISFGEGSYATPVWSPRGDYIAFTKIKDGTFYIGLMRPDGTAERLIAQGFLVEGPTWSPNGRFIAFGRQEKSSSWNQNGNPRIYSIDVTGYNERLLKTPDEASDPAWSYLLH